MPTKLPHNVARRAADRVRQLARYLTRGELAEPPPLLWLAHILGFSRDTSNDDRSLLAIWPRTIGGPA